MARRKSPNVAFVGPLLILRRCTGECGEWLTEGPANFYVQRRRKDGSARYRSDCKPCYAARCREGDAERRDLRRARWAVEDPYGPEALAKYGDVKWCPSCEQELPRRHANWHPVRSRSDGLSGRCRLCDGARKLHLTVAEMRHLLEESQGICYLCCLPFGPDDVIHIDHIIPKRRGGTDDLWNLAPAHEFCNLTKFAKPYAAAAIALAPERLRGGFMGSVFGDIDRLGPLLLFVGATPVVFRWAP